jgi:moderate conductance mechanosensitive channel
MLHKAFEVIKLTGDRLQLESDMAGKFLGETEVLGVIQLADSAVTVRMRVKVPAQEQWFVKRRLLSAVKDAFEKIRH